LSGRKHHHVPQFLQRRFGQTGRKSTKVFVYRNDGKVFPTSTENYGAERDFYAEGDDFFVDDLITDYEGDIQPFLGRLIEGESSALDDSRTISEIVSHLEMRSAFLRSQMIEISGVLAEFLQKTFADRGSAKKMLAACFVENPEMLRDAITQHFGSDGVSVALEEFVTPQIGTLIEKSIQPLLDSLTDTLFNARSLFAGSIKPAHLKALRSHPADVARRNTYEGFAYKLQKLHDCPLILPDTMVAFSTKSRLTPFTQKNDEVVEIFLPLSSETLLIGCKKTPIQRTGFEMKSILASTSFASFIAQDDSPQLRKLAKKIGRNAILLPEAEARRIFREVVAELTSKTTSRR
jgi:hypothetical protein